jgi:hypothetical protein
VRRLASSRAASIPASESANDAIVILLQRF